jgi:hypothetical protein
MPAILQNNDICAGFDEAGRLIALHSNEHPNPVRPYVLWRAVIEFGGRREIEVRPVGDVEISANENSICLTFSRCAARNGESFPIAVCCQGIMEGDELRWQLQLENRLPNSVFREIQFPILPVAHDVDPFSILLTTNGGERFNDFFTNIEKFSSAYSRQDHRYLRCVSLYPGSISSMNFLAVDFNDHGLYCGCHDPEFDATLHVLELEQETKSCNLFMVHYPFLKFAESAIFKEFVLSPWRGTWHKAAEKYRAWAEQSWFTPPEIPQHIRYSEGWQRLILKQQCGETLHPYDSLGEKAKDAAKAGIDTQFLFGWTEDGMDSGYPDYKPDDQQGGLAALKKAIASIQSQGGRVILYFNGQLIDTDSQYYRSGKGQQASIKRKNGIEHREFYNFAGEGTFFFWFGNKIFVVACPAVKEWHAILKEHADLALRLGVDSIFYDQLGSIQQLCYDPTHGHKIPFTGIMKEKREMLKELREYIKSKSPDTGLGIEIISDQTAQYADFIHICVGPRNPTYDGKSIEPFTELFKFTFPEIILSNRDIRDEACDYKRRVNEMMLLGSHSDIEIYRCRESIAVTPNYRDYLAKANALRERFRDVLLGGRFISTLGHHSDNSRVRTNAFVLDQRLAVVMTNRNPECESVRIEAPGYEFQSFASALDDVTMRSGRFFLPEAALCVLLFYQRVEKGG